MFFKEMLTTTTRPRTVPRALNSTLPHLTQNKAKLLSKKYQKLKNEKINLSNTDYKEHMN